MANTRQKKEIESTNPTLVDIDLAAAAFIAGRRAEQLTLSGEEMVRLFVGCVTELRPEANKFEAHRYMGKALIEARDGKKA